MRHRHSRLRLRQKPAHSRQLQKNLVTSLLLYEAIRTTKKRAEVVQPIIDRLIARAKVEPPYRAIRYMNRILVHPNASRKIMEVFVRRYKDRPSGFTRIVPVGSRHGDGAKVVDLVLVDAESSVPAVTEKKPESRVQKPETTNQKPATKKLKLFSRKKKS